MTGENQEKKTAEQFIVETIDSVPHLEALLLLWNSRPVQWSAEQMAQRLFVDAQAAERILQDLVRKNLIAVDESKRYGYISEGEKDQLMAAVDETYRKDLVRLTTAIHTKGPPSVQDFARAFRLKKD